MLPSLTTFLVFVLLLQDDPGQGTERFWERVLETGIGVGVAAVFGLIVPALLERRGGGAGRGRRS